MPSASQCRFIGMLHVPINSILTYSPPLRQSLQLPSPTIDDWALIQEMEQLASQKVDDSILESPTLDFGIDVISRLEEKAGQLSFTNFLQDRMLSETELYFACKADSLMLENIAAPYFVRERQPIVIYAVMSLLAKAIRREYPNGCFGIQILAFGENLAMDIAVRYSFSFIRGESLLFGGMRPEGVTPNQGNLARVYMQRNRLVDTLNGREKDMPKVYVDLQKKHTVFADNLALLDNWLENLLFFKLEGVVLTGSGTGKETNLGDIKNAYKAVTKTVQRAKTFIDSEWTPKIIVGSGVTGDNLAECKKYATAVIVGSSLKENGYWECTLDNVRLQEFMEKWHKEA